MASFLSSSFLLIQYIVVINAMRESALYRNAVGDFSVGDFKQNPFHYLWVKKLASSMAADQIDCTFLCVGELKCHSFNMAVYPDSKGLYLCELLATDKYRAKTKFHANATYHHYSPKSPCESDPCMNGADCVPEYELNTFHCNCTQGFCGTHCEQSVYKNCAELYKAGQRLSGVYAISPDNITAFDVFCDQTTAGGGWTVFQKRLDGSVDFYRGWDDYKRGFGYLSAEFWLGLDKIHRLTKERSRLRVELEDWTGKTAYAEYDFFSVTSERSKYNLSVGTYSGNAGDSLSYHSGMAFSTKDRDNDIWSGHCATRFKGAWWYYWCRYSNLNGLYLHGNHSKPWEGVDWYHWKGNSYSAKRAEMKIRPV